MYRPKYYHEGCSLKSGVTLPLERGQRADKTLPGVIEANTRLDHVIMTTSTSAQVAIRLMYQKSF